MDGLWTVYFLHLSFIHRGLDAWTVYSPPRPLPCLTRGGDIPTPSILKLASLIALGIRLTGWVNRLRMDAIAALTASATTAAATEQGSQRVLGETLAPAPFGPRGFRVVLQLRHQL